MPKLKNLYPKTSTWGDLNNKLIKHYRIPNGYRFALRRKGKNLGKRPFVRADSEIRRKLFERASHPRDTNPNVTEICGLIERMLAPANRTGVVALQPNGELFDGHNKLKTWQKLPGRPTPEERNARETHRGVVEELRRLADMMLDNLEEGVEDPNTAVVEAVLQALADRYGTANVRSGSRLLSSR